MSQTSLVSIISSIEFVFEDAKTRDSSYNSYLPELDRAKTERSKISMKKNPNNVLIFHIESKDITAFRSSISDVIGFGKIIDNLLKISKI
jgi:tRNA threonylcarbamoyladenosine modification (KEOPS) complex  Pcc1 subunit